MMPSEAVILVSPVLPGLVSFVEAHVKQQLKHGKVPGTNIETVST